MKDKADPQSVIDKPRWAFPYTIYEKPNSFITESDNYVEETWENFP
jgi:hypothetical protein